MSILWSEYDRSALNWTDSVTGINPSHPPHDQPIEEETQMTAQGREKSLLRDGYHGTNAITKNIHFARCYTIGTADKSILCTIAI